MGSLKSFGHDCTDCALYRNQPVTGLFHVINNLSSGYVHFRFWIFPGGGGGYFWASDVKIIRTVTSASWPINKRIRLGLV